MSIETHMHAVARKRSEIKEQIAEEMAHPMPDFMKITELKKQNMKLKEMMMQLSIAHSKQSTSTG